MVWDLIQTDDSQRLTITVRGEPIPYTGAAAYGFLLEPSDRIVIVLKWKGAEPTGEITYAVTGTNLDVKDLDQLKKLISGGAPEAKEAGRGALADTVRTEMKAVTDDLIAGGKLTITFSLKQKQGTGANQQEVSLYTSGPLTFRIADRPPRFTVSTGIAVSGAPEPTVAIVKTANVISFEKDGKTQQAYEQTIVLRDSEVEARPIQSAVTYANFRLYRSIYASFGVQLNQKIFEEPLLGVTYRHSLGGSMGVNFTGGVVLSRETQIIDSSGFEVGMKIDPTLGLTVDDIPTEQKYHGRYMFGFSVDF
jgi:hypothetical protein